MNEYKLLQYVGKKPSKPDTVARTGVVWTGHGDIKAVPMPQADRLLRHPDVWREVDASGKPVTLGVPVILNESAAEQVAELPPALPEQADDQAPEGPADPAPPTGEDAVIADIKAAIRTLERGNEEHFTEQGKPRVSAVRAAMPEDAVFQLPQLNQAWKEIEAAEAADA